MELALCIIITDTATKVLPMPRRRRRRLNSPGRDAWQRPEVILAALGLSAGETLSGKTVADLGAGTGYMVGHLSRAVGERGTVVAVDVEAAMVAYLAERARRARAGEG